MPHTREEDIMQVSLKAMRVNAQKKCKDVADALGVTETTVQNWEAGRTSPDAVQFGKLCSFYGCSRDDIFLPDNLAKSEK